MSQRFIVETVNGLEPGYKVTSAVVINETVKYVVFLIDGANVPLPKKSFPVYGFVSFGTSFKITFKSI